MPRYLHRFHTPDTARTLTLSGRNCLVVSGIVTHPKSATGADKGAEASMRPTSRSLHVGMPTDDVDVDKEYQLIPLDSL